MARFWRAAHARPPRTRYHARPGARGTRRSCRQPGSRPDIPRPRRHWQDMLDTFGTSVDWCGRAVQIGYLHDNSNDTCITQVPSLVYSMLGNTYDREICSAARALEIAGERWSLLILRNAAFAGMTRFSEFEKGLRIAPNILAARLERFVEEGLMTV